jgi:hypothetical protein
MDLIIAESGWVIPTNEEADISQQAVISIK